MEKYIAKKLSKAAVLEQMAEEAAELAQAALKLARIYRGENPTPNTEDAAVGLLNEEMSDVMVCETVLEAKGIMDRDLIVKIYEYKMQRWCEMLMEKEESK